MAEQLEEIMSPLMSEIDYSDVITDLTTRNFISQDDSFKPTEDGIKFHTKILARQTSIRNAVMKDISQEEYEITVSTLQRIIKNLGRV